ncbi:MAG: hypothetical protein C0602_00285 [Denitrovibrio sp.]|nr:MAG: hypothetical protein C0602_00285 [Denitrovibrio sp.]
MSYMTVSAEADGYKARYQQCNYSMLVESMMKKHGLHRLEGGEIITEEDIQAHRLEKLKATLDQINQKEV